MRFVVAASLLLLAAPASAKIHRYDSVEWLCHRAEAVVRGVLVAVSAVEPADQAGKDRDLVSLTLQPTDYLKGAGPGTTSPPPIHFSMRLPDATRLTAWMKDRTELVVFLRSTPQGYRRDGVEYHLWPVRLRANDEQAVVELAKPHVHLFSAGEMKVVKAPEQISAACRRADGARQPQQPTSPGGSPIAWDLEVPPTSEIYPMLYSGSACYLTVPDGVFEGTKPSP